VKPCSPCSATRRGRSGSKQAAASFKPSATQFDIYHRASGTTVSVIEGVVLVSPERRTTAPTFLTAPIPLSAGEQASIAPNGRIVKAAAADMDRAMAWRQRRLVFRSDSLASVAAEFNRYNTLKIRVEGEAVQGRQLIGTFNADDPESLVQFLAQEQDLKVERGEDVLVIRAP
jgi:transmembrane sensor